MDLSGTVSTLNVLGDESRIRLCALLRERELSVTDLVRVTGISQSRVSTHLARLREAGFVRDRRDGPRSFYALADGIDGTARTLLDAATASGDATLARDKKRLSDLDAERRGGLPESFAGEMERHYSPGRTWQSLALGLTGLLELGDVLDVGSGDGAVAATLAPHCRSLTCIDSSPRMIEAAKVRLARHAHVKAELADGHDLPFRAGAFDAVVVFHTLTFAERPQRVLDECARVLRPGGKIVVLTLDAHGHRDVTAPYGERHPGLSPRALRGMLGRAGLTISTCEVVCREPKKPHFEVVLSVSTKRTKQSARERSKQVEQEQA